jgi:quinoprotein relay system zinc metallohydrolase 2
LNRAIAAGLLLVLSAFLIGRTATLTYSQGVLAPLSVSEVAPGAYVHFGVNELMNAANEGAIANVGFIIGNDGVAVIDTGGSVLEGKRLGAAIKNVTAKPIRYVINTHGHPDHVFGNAAFTPDAVFIGHQNLPRALAARGQYYIDAFRNSMGPLVDDVKIVLPAFTLGGEAKLDLGGRRLLLKAWPTAHSESDLTVLDETTGTLFAGDLVFLRHIPVLDGSLRGWLAALDDLARLPAKQVVPGHGPAAAAWPDALNNERAYLQRLAADCREMIKQGVPIAVAVQRAAASEKSHWELFDDYNARNATAAYSELEWE